MREGSCRKEFSYDSLALVVIKFRSFSNILPKNSVACFESRTARVIEAIIRIIIITHENMQNFFDGETFLQMLHDVLKAE